MTNIEGEDRFLLRSLIFHFLPIRQKNVIIDHKNRDFYQKEIQQKQLFNFSFKHSIIRGSPSRNRMGGALSVPAEP